jgi:chaperonin cofactor prefoldin
MRETQSLDQVVQLLQMVSQQLAAVQAQVREIEATLGHLTTQDPSRAIYQQVGPLLIEVDDLETLQSNLSDSLGQLKGHLKTLEAKEAELRSTYEEAVKQFETA